MEHEWESKIAAVILKMRAILPPGYELLGVAVEAIDKGEGALVRTAFINGPKPGDVPLADVWQDIMNDGIRHYQDTAHVVFERKKGMN